MVGMQEDLKQLQEEIAREQDEKLRLEETVQNVSKELNRYKNELQQEQLKYNTAIQEMEQIIQKEKKENCT